MCGYISAPLAYRAVHDTGFVATRMGNTVLSARSGRSYRWCGKYEPIAKFLLQIPCLLLIRIILMGFI